MAADQDRDMQDALVAALRGDEAMRDRILAVSARIAREGWPIDRSGTRQQGSPAPIRMTRDADGVYRSVG